MDGSKGMSPAGAGLPALSISNIFQSIQQKIKVAEEGENENKGSEESEPVHTSSALEINPVAQPVSATDSQSKQSVHVKLEETLTECASPPEAGQTLAEDFSGPSLKQPEDSSSQEREGSGVSGIDSGAENQPSTNGGVNDVQFKIEHQHDANGGFDNVTVKNEKDNFSEVDYRRSRMGHSYRIIEDDSDSDMSDTSESSSLSAIEVKDDSDDSLDAPHDVPKKVDKYAIALRTAGEIFPEELPPIEDLHISINENTQLEELGVVTAIVGVLVVIKSTANLQKYSPLNDDTVLFYEDRQPFGKVFEVFGQCQDPSYTVRFNSVADIASKGIKADMKIYFVPEPTPDVGDITHYVFLDRLQRIKGSDASWTDNNEPPAQFLDYSDDEEEQRAKSRRKAVVSEQKQIKRCKRTVEKSMNEHSGEITESTAATSNVVNPQSFHKESARGRGIRGGFRTHGSWPRPRCPHSNTRNTVHSDGHGFQFAQNSSVISSASPQNFRFRNRFSGPPSGPGPSSNFLQQGACSVPFNPPLTSIQWVPPPANPAFADSPRVPGPPVLPASLHQPFAHGQPSDHFQPGYHGYGPSHPVATFQGQPQFVQYHPAPSPERFQGWNPFQSGI